MCFCAYLDTDLNTGQNMTTTNHISKARDRAKLPERRSPYWQQVKRGYQIGCRKLNGAEYWLARAYIGNGKYEQRPLPGVGSWEQALQQSKGFFEHVECGGTVSRDTVGEVFLEYCNGVKESTTHSTVKNSLGNLANVGINDPKLGAHLAAWLKSDAVRKKTTKKGITETDRAPATIKRMTTALKAALNQAKKKIVSTDWEESLSVPGGDDNPRDLYLTPDQRRQLIESADKDAQTFIRLLCLLPLRPGDWHHLTVAHFDKHQRTLAVASKNIARNITLSAAAFELLTEAARDKTPKAPLFVRSNGSQWDSQSWNEDIKQAASRAGLPPETCAYTLRHSVITDLVAAGLDLLQVSKLAGTSLRMIEKHYGKNLRDRQASALDLIAV